jgi:hypothetical protein
MIRATIEFEVLDRKVKYRFDSRSAALVTAPATFDKEGEA